MTGSDLKRTGTRQDFDTTTNQPVVLMQFTDSGAKKFEDITRTLVERGRNLANQQGLPGGAGNDDANQQFAIVLDREMKSAPSVDFDDNPNGIPGNNGAQITGISISDAKDLALVLRSGTLPFKLITIEQTNISATLGKDSLEEAKKAAIGGLILVAIFLLLFYRFLGLVAVIGLGIYAAFLYAAVLLFNVTLSLPGFAGLILTIGVAADANVVVFERIKEEVRAGKSVRAGIAAGYSKGFHTIIDANVVTAITAMVLFLVATAGVKGFALMLLIGTIISLVTAVAATRAMLGLLAGFRWFDNPRFMGAQGQQGAKWLQIDFMRRRYLWFACSGAIVLLAIGALGVRGLNLGIDFKGGTQVTFDTPQPQLVEDVRDDAKSIDPSFAKAIIQGRGPVTDGKYKSFQLKEKSIDPALGVKLKERSRVEVERDALRGEERLGELRPSDCPVGDHRDHRLALPDRPLSGDPVRPQVRVPGDRGSGPRPRDHRRRVLTDREGSVDIDGRGRPDRARILDLRHDHHLRPHPGKRAADAARPVRDDRQHLALGDDQALPGDDVHHAAAGRIAALLRRRHAQGLRFRPADRNRRRRVLVDLHRRAAAHDSQGARARVRAEDRPGRPRARRPGAGRRYSGEAAATGSDRRACGRHRNDRSRGRRAGRRGGARAQPAWTGWYPTRLPPALRPRRSVSAGGNDAGPSRMAADNDGSVLDLLERFGLAALGAVALTADRADALADELAKTGGMRRDEARELIEQTTRRWRGEAVRASERAGAGLEGLFKQLGLVSRSDFEELSLRVAQLEHRLRLVEGDSPAAGTVPH